MSCRILNFSEEIEIRLPQHDSDFFQITKFSWILEYRDSYGNIRTESIDSGKEHVFIEVEKGKIQPFIIRAKTIGNETESFKTKPAGFVYGVSSKKKGEYRFEWKSGFISLLLLDISEFMDPRLINTKRLTETIIKVAEGDNYWILDRVMIRDQLLSGDFRVYDIRQLRKRSIELLLPAGCWFSNNLFDDNIQVNSIENPVSVEVLTGNTQYYHALGYHLEIEMSSDGSYEYIVY